MRLYLLVEGRMVAIQRERSIPCDTVPTEQDVYTWFPSPLLQYMKIAISQNGAVWEENPAHKTKLYSIVLSIPETMPLIRIMNRQKRVVCVVPHKEGLTATELCEFLSLINVMLSGHPHVNYEWDGPDELPSYMMTDSLPLFHTVMVRAC